MPAAPGGALRRPSVGRPGRANDLARMGGVWADRPRPVNAGVREDWEVRNSWAAAARKLRNACVVWLIYCCSHRYYLTWIPFVGDYLFDLVSLIPFVHFSWFFTFATAACFMVGCGVLLVLHWFATLELGSPREVLDFLTPDFIRAWLAARAAATARGGAGAPPAAAAGAAAAAAQGAARAYVEPGMPQIGPQYPGQLGYAAAGSQVGQPQFSGFVRTPQPQGFLAGPDTQVQQERVNLYAKGDPGDSAALAQHALGDASVGSAGQTMRHSPLYEGIARQEILTADGCWQMLNKRLCGRPARHSVQPEAQLLMHEVRRHLSELAALVEDCDARMRQAAESRQLQIPSQDIDLRDYLPTISLKEQVEKKAGGLGGFGGFGGGGFGTGGGFGGFGTTTGFGGFGTGFGTTATTTTQTQQQPRKYDMLKKVQEWLESEKRTLQAAAVLDTRKFELYQRMSALVDLRLRLEPMMAIEATSSGAQAMPQQFESQAARTQQVRTKRQGFLRKLREIRKESMQSMSISDTWQLDTRDCEVVTHCVASLVDFVMRGGVEYNPVQQAKADFKVQCSNTSEVLSYCHSRCPGLLVVCIIQTLQQPTTQYMVTHQDTNRGLREEYPMTPGSDSALYEALLHFLLVFEHAHPDKVRREHSESTAFTTMSRRFFEHVAPTRHSWY
eukprot:TRINITY_DN15208_c0_g1_i4.p1 TRINITY_DN15208_c0_g1~~TRINITY_DN15208_c0_g1_i4.p1  ORF type:complete len:713 (+),score=216.27 TRINITY_DN15208_c0_g1_i4:124-2139(+)